MWQIVATTAIPQLFCYPQWIQAHQDRIAKDDLLWCIVVICCSLYIIGSDADVNRQNTWALPALCQEMFYWYTLCALIRTEQGYTDTEYCCWPHASLYDCNLIMATFGMLFSECAMSQSSNRLNLATWTWQWVQCTSVASPVTGSESNRAL